MMERRALRPRHSGFVILAFFLALSLSSCAELAKSPALVVGLPLTDGAGDVARDISGNGNHGRISGAEWQRDKPASSLLFRFSPNNFVEIGSSPSLHIRGDTTYMVWGWVESFPLEQIATLFSTNVSSKPSLLLRVYALGPVFWEMYDKAGNRIYMSQDVGLKPGWHHFALVRQGKTGYFYLDGELKNQTTNSRLAQVYH